MSHPALIPELHPMCGKLMEDLVKCRKENVYERYTGFCNGLSFELSKCLKEEKKVVRQPRLERFQEKWNEKKKRDAEQFGDVGQMKPPTVQ